MIANPRKLAKVWLLIAISFAEFRLVASDPTIDWHYIGAGPPVTTFTLAPTNPSTLSPVTFIAPTDGISYGNSCFASLENGFPRLVVDPTNHTIAVTFSGYPEVCPYVILPVSGVEAHVGLLSEGIWSVIVVRKLPQPPGFYSFAVAALAPPLSLQTHAGSSSLELSWPVSAETYALEASDNLSSGNWQIITNSPTISSNRYTLQISGSSGSRFFRLHRL